MWLLLAIGIALVHAPDDRAPPPKVRVGFVGDVSFAGRADAPGAVFAGVAPVLSAPDLTVANVEGLLLKGGAPAYAEARLDISAAPDYAAAFAGSGVDVLGTANNHIWDAGAEGVREHLAHLATSGLATFGSGADADAAYASWRHTSAAGCLAFVPAALKSNRPPRAGASAALYGARGRPLTDLYARVATERASGCAPIVFVHWGREGRAFPDDGVVTVAHALVDAGAALVVGHHPHVLQGFEHRGTALIAWSLGNFVFRNRDPDKRRTGMLDVELAPGTDGVARVVSATFVPLTIDARTFAPRPATDAEAAAHLRELTRRSEPFGARLERGDGGALRIPAP